jgi:UDP-2,3-diacylglucosamine pyrophosphatase LpxH
MLVPFYDTVILSDLHLGSETSRANAALQMLKTTSFRRLILLGDIFCDLNFRRLKKEHWQFLGYIRKLSNPKRHVEVVWVEGNHDHGLSDVMSHLVGVKVFQEYIWNFRGIRHLAIHGHQFDRFVLGSMPLSRLLTTVYLQLQKLDFANQRVARCFDHLDTTWLRLSSKVASGALNHAEMKNVDRIFCGHTHEALCLSRNQTQYFNTGSWTQAVATYVTIDEEGVRIHEYTERADDRDSCQERGEADSAFADLAASAGLLDDFEYEDIPC